LKTEFLKNLFTKNEFTKNEFTKKPIQKNLFHKKKLLLKIRLKNTKKITNLNRQKEIKMCCFMGVLSILKIQFAIEIFYLKYINLKKKHQFVKLRPLNPVMMGFIGHGF